METRTEPAIDDAAMHYIMGPSRAPAERVWEECKKMVNFGRDGKFKISLGKRRSMSTIENELGRSNGSMHEALF